MDDFQELKSRYKTLSDIVSELKSECMFERLVKDWDDIFYSKTTNEDRLLELNKRYICGYYTMSKNLKDGDYYGKQCEPKRKSNSRK